MNALEIKNLRKSYGQTLAVDDISFNIEKGQFYGFLGPNGSGKTTTIHCVTGVARYLEGSIKVFGIDARHNYREARRKVGLSPQEFNVDIFSPVHKMLDYVGGYYGMRKPERQERINILLKQFELETHANKAFRELSGGLKRRAMLARAMVHDPELLILDEPTAGVDVELRHELWRFLEELNKNGKTILLTSHYLEEVEKLCDYVTIINKGKIVASDGKEHFLKDGNSLEQTYLKITQGESW